jgi:hypothetical protein
MSRGVVISNQACFRHGLWPEAEQRVRPHIPLPDRPRQRLFGTSCLTLRVAQGRPKERLLAVARPGVGDAEV